MLMLCLQIAPFVDITSVLLDSGVITLPHLIGPESSTNNQNNSANTMLWMLMCTAALMLIAGVIVVLAWHSWSTRQRAWDNDPYDSKGIGAQIDQSSNPFL